MKKQYVIIGIVAILVFIGLSGCEDTNKNIIGNGVELVSYSVVTKWSETDHSHIEPGFNHSIPENAFNIQYKINVTVKNIAEKPLNLVYVTCIFYDNNNNELFTFNSDSGPIMGLANDYCKNLTYSIYSSDTPYFSNADHISFNSYNISKS